jgi:hypothetical protein
VNVQEDTKLKNIPTLINDCVCPSEDEEVMPFMIS